MGCREVLSAGLAGTHLDGARISSPATFLVLPAAPAGAWRIAADFRRREFRPPGNLFGDVADRRPALTSVSERLAGRTGSRRVELVDGQILRIDQSFVVRVAKHGIRGSRFDRDGFGHEAVPHLSHAAIVARGTPRDLRVESPFMR